MFVITSHHLVHSFMHHSTDFITLECWPTATPSTLWTTFMYIETPTSCFLCWLQLRRQRSLPSCSTSHLNLELLPSPYRISILSSSLIPLTYRQHSTKPHNHNFHWIQISSLVCTTQLHDTPQTKIFRFAFSQPCWETHQC